MFRFNSYILTFLAFITLQGTSHFVHAQTRYVELTDSIFRVGDKFNAHFVIRFTLGPKLQLGNERCVHVDEEQIDHFDRFIAFLKERKNLIVEIGSHTDFRGNPLSNIDLSRRRAEFIKNCFIDSGVDSSQLVAKGYGSSQPRTVYRCGSEYFIAPPQVDSLSCDSVQLTNAYISSHRYSKVLFERLHQFNRRIEFKIVGVLGEE